MNPLRFASLVRDLVAASDASDRDLKMGWVPARSVLPPRDSEVFDVLFCPCGSAGVGLYVRPDGAVRIRFVAAGLFCDAWLPARPALAPYQRFAELTMQHLPEHLTASRLNRGINCPGWRQWVTFARPDCPDVIGP
jgi:hypothetical protein